MGATLTYLGHSTFSVKTPGGKTLFIDPWLEGNPRCPEALKKAAACDVMLITHGHFDHTSDVIPLAQAHKPQVVGIFELCSFFGGKGVENLNPMSKGGTLEVAGIKVTLTHAQHSSSLVDDGKAVYAGEPVGFVVEFEDGRRLYHAGDTNIFGDMRLIAEIYRPELALLPICGRFTMSPLEAAHACRLMDESVKKVIPIHYATFPLLTGTPEALRKELKGLKLSTEVIALEPGQSHTM
ncbi:MAG: metal-dependent hydrolase [Nitrospinota bacterium]